MANKRMINGETWEDEFFTELTIFERLLWIGIITQCADDQGRFRDNVALIRSNVFPIDDIRLEDIEQALTQYSKAGKIVRYKADNKHLIQIVNWWKHQKPRWASASNYPTPEKWTDRFRYHGEGNSILESNWKLSGGYIADSIVDSIPCEDESEDDVKDDVKDESKFSNFDDVQIFIEKTTGFPPNGGEAVKAINEILNMGAIKEDVTDAYKWLCDNGVNVRYYQKLVNPTRTSMANRLKQSSGKKRTIKIDGQEIEVGMP